MIDAYSLPYFGNNKKVNYNIVPMKWAPPNTEESASKEAVKVPVRKDEIRRIQNEEKRWERFS